MLVLGGLLTLDPAVVGLSQTPPLLHAVALRGLLGLAGVALGLVLVLVSLLMRRTRGKGRRLLVLGVVAVLIGGGHLGVLAERGTSPGDPLGAAPDGAIDVLTLNVQGDPGSAELVAVVDELAPDVVALQEIAPDDAARVADGVAGDYDVFTHTTGTRPLDGTALLVSTGLGEYQQGEAPSMTFGSVWARPVDGVGPELFSVHPVPPLGGLVPTWASELDTVVGLCDRIERVVIAGDLNATLDHAVLRGASCEDGSVGSGGVGTWPADRAPLLGAAIDHVLIDPSTWHAESSRVIDAPAGGDHRAVLVRIVPMDAGGTP